MTHPDASELALFAGADLPCWRRWRLARHLRHCPECRLELDVFRRQRDAIRQAGTELPPDLNWSRLATDMKANIHLGLAAGECVAPPELKSRPLGWRIAAALASFALVMISGWWLQLPHPHWRGRAAAEGTVLQATGDGIELKQQDRALMLVHASSEPVLVSVDLEGVMEARYIDDQTGMVTINNVYAQ